MTVQELSKLLAQYPGDMRVVVDGYEDGFDDIELDRVLVREIRLDAGSKCWEGRQRHQRRRQPNRKRLGNPPGFGLVVEAQDWTRLPESFHREIEREFVALVRG